MGEQLNRLLREVEVWTELATGFHVTGRGVALFSYCCAAFLTAECLWWGIMWHVMFCWKPWEIVLYHFKQVPSPYSIGLGVKCKLDVLLCSAKTGPVVKWPRTRNPGISIRDRSISLRYMFHACSHLQSEVTAACGSVLLPPKRFNFTAF